ncbi:hypothetical protein HMPREF0204_12604 [Chryseobacterium gleum ATCC 35910]|uniref:Uncharacterized protein n=1 Tax=Chryseobacterium gleum ATCC 35910 TaxID=525257 RepID=A0ABN0AKV5_CHRGE|nr:hypothetical protein HMPREF0204_12604 [Chryseobacterium gleum ATCC 35910]
MTSFSELANFQSILNNCSQISEICLFWVHHTEIVFGLKNTTKENRYI